jgi:hypothetical protein
MESFMLKNAMQYGLQGLKRGAFEWALALGLVGMLGMAAPALACSCVGIEDWDAHARDAEFIFTGKAIQRTDWQPVADSVGVIIFSSDDPTVYEFEVDETIKGIGESEGAALRVWTVRDDASCGYNFLLDSAYLVFAYKPVGDTVLRTGSCSGNEKLGSHEPDSILSVVKAALATNAVSGARAAGTRFRPEGALKNLERKDRRMDGRRVAGQPEVGGR